MTRNRPPSGSKWTIGLSVSRPNIFAVESPSRQATNAWRELVHRERDEQEDRDQEDRFGRDLEHGRLVGRRGCRVSYPALEPAEEVAFFASYSAGVIAPRSRRRPIAADEALPEQLCLLRLELLRGDRAPVAEVGEAGERLRHLGRGHRRGCGAGAVATARRRHAGQRRRRSSSSAAAARSARVAAGGSARSGGETGGRICSNSRSCFWLSISFLKAMTPREHLVAVDRLLGRGEDVEVAVAEDAAEEVLVEHGVVDLLERAVGRVLVDEPDTFITRRLVTMYSSFSQFAIVERRSARGDHEEDAARDAQPT